MSEKKSLQNRVYNLWFGPGKGVETPIPSTGPQRMWFIIKNNYIQMMLLNLLFIVFCLPVITIPAALAGMTKILVKWTRDDNVYFWQDFFSEFKTDFFKRLIAWLFLNLTPVSISLYPYILGFGREGSIVLLILTGSLSFLIQSYLFPIFVTLDLSVWAAVKNAFILTFLEWKNSLSILFTSGILYSACFLFTLYALPFFVLFLVVFCQLMTCVWVNEKINNRLTLPH